MIISSEEIAIRKSRFTELQIIAFLKFGEGVNTVKDVYGWAAVSEASCYNRKAKHGGTEAADIDLEDDNCHLKRILAEFSLESRVFIDPE